MTVTFTLTGEMEARLRRLAASLGKDASAIAREAVEEKLDAPRTFAEILAPVHEAFAAEGLTDDQWASVFERLRGEAAAERRRTDAA